MARVSLSEEGSPHRIAAVGVDGFYGSAPVGLDDDGCCAARVIPGRVPEPDRPGEHLPTITVRGRVWLGYDEYGNQMWDWTTLVEDAPAITYEEREERDDRSGLTIVTATVLFSYADDRPEIRETAVVRTTDGRVWDVHRATRSPGRYELHIGRQDQPDRS